MNSPVMRTRVKICGITRCQDAEVAVEAGADALGLVFYSPSPRAVELDDAVRIARSIPAFVSIVALFVDPEPVLVQAVIDRVGPDLLQFHGGESPGWCGQFRRPFLKALRVREGLALEEEASRYREARGLLLDSYRPGVPGGTGESFDWDLIPPALRSRIVLAGGLDPDNVGEAIRRVHPFAVDVSGGVERAKGVKDAGKIRRFIEQVQCATGPQLGAARA